MALGDIATMDSVEPPEYRQKMIDEWTAWLDIFNATFLKATSIGIYDAFPDADSVLWSMHRRYVAYRQKGDEPEAMAQKWANIYLVKQQQPKEVGMETVWIVLGVSVGAAACFALGCLIARAFEWLERRLG